MWRRLLRRERRTGDVAHLVIVEDGLSTVIADHVIGVDLSVTWSAALQWKIGTRLVRLANYIKSAGGLKLGG